MIIKREWDVGEKEGERKEERERCGLGIERILRMRMSLATKSRRRRIIKREAIENERGRTRMVAKDERNI